MAILPVLLPLLGALAMLLVRRRPERVWWAVATLTALLNWLVVLGLGAALPAAARLAVWRPETLFASRIELMLEPISWRFTYAAATLLLAVQLTSAARPGEATAFGRAAALAYAGLATAALLPGNLLTVAMSWALIDLARFIVQMVALPTGSAGRDLVWRLAVDMVGVLLVVGAALADRLAGGEADLLEATPATGAIVVLCAAALFRLGLLPPHFNLPAPPGLRRGAGTLLRLLPPASALVVIARALHDGAPESVIPWLRAAGAVGVLIGGARWALKRDAIEGRRFLVLGISGLAMMAAGQRAETAADAVAAAGVLLLLIGGLVSLIELHSPSHRVWPVLGGVMLAGLPLSAGGVLASAFGDGLTDPLGVGMAVVGGAGLAALGLGVTREALRPLSPWPTGESLVRTAYGLGLALPALVAVGLGMWAPGAATWRGLTVFGLSALVSAAALLWARRSARRRLERARRMAEMLDPGPLYRAAWRVFGQAVRATRALTALFEGEAAMLWAYVIVLLVWLAVA